MADQTKSKRIPQTNNFHGTPFLNGHPQKQIPVERDSPKMGIQTDDDSSNSSPSSIMVVMDASHGKANLNALDWAIKYIVRPKDTVVVLGVLPELGKKTAPTCFPFHMGIGTSGIWVKLEFSTSGDMTRSELQDEIERKKQEFQIMLLPFCRQFKKSELNLETRLAAGFDPWKATVEEAQKFNPRWIVLDSCLKKDKELILGQVACTVAVMKRKGVATLTPYNFRGPECEQWQKFCKKKDDIDDNTTFDFGKHEGELNSTPQDTKSYYGKPTLESTYVGPLSWRTGFPRSFSVCELEEITKGFADEYILLVKNQKKVYAGVYLEAPVLIISFPGNDDLACSIFKIISRVRHRSILNLVGYCCTDDAMFLIYDHPGNGTLEMTLQCYESAENLCWKDRWHAAMEIGAGLRYLHEECANGPIVNLSLCSANVVFCQGSSPMLSMYHTTMKWLKFDNHSKEESPTKCNDQDDVQCYGVILIELISGKSQHHVDKKWEGRSLIGWALPLLEKGLVSQIMDPRLEHTDQAGVLRHMAQAALMCLKNDSSHKFTISQVLAVLRGDQYAVTNY